jgi:hypothetical protein
MKIRFAAFAALLALAGCHSQPTAGGVTPEDERELDNAAAMIEQQNVFTASDGLAANEAEVAGPGNTAVPSPVNGSSNAP